MRTGTLSYVLIRAATGVTDGESPSGLVTEGRDTFVFTVDLSAPIASGYAVFRLEFINANNQWQGMHEEQIDADTTAVVPIYISPFPTRRVRGRITVYEALADESSNPVAVSLSCDCS